MPHMEAYYRDKKPAVESTRSPSSQRGTAGVNPDRARVSAAVASTRTPSSQRGAAGVNPDRARVNSAVESTRTPSSQRGAAGVNPDPPRVNATVESTRTPFASTRPSSQPGPRSSQRGRRVNPNAARVNGLDSSQPGPVRVDVGYATFLRIGPAPPLLEGCYALYTQRSI